MVEIPRQAAAAGRDGKWPMRSRDPAPLLPQPARTGTDWHPTPPCLILALTRFVLPGLPPGPVWEPCAGDGRLARAIEAEGRRVIATDIAPRCAVVARRRRRGRIARHKPAVGSRATRSAN